MIEVSGLVKRYGFFEAVKGVSFKVEPGRVVGLLGPNGAGKTTIMKVLTAYHRASEGTALLNGLDVALDPLGVKRIMGYLPETVPLYLDMTVREQLGFAAMAHGIKTRHKISDAIERVMQACSLSGFEDVRINRLSKGYRQRTGLAQALIHDPEILILDEPTSGLDPNQILEIRSLIRSLAEKKTVILSTHILQEVEAMCSEVLILNEGSIAAQGSAAKIAESLQGGEKLDFVIYTDSKLSSGKWMDAEAGLGLYMAESHQVSENSRRFVVKTEIGKGDELAIKVFDWAVANGFKLLEIKREQLSMEEIFVRLTGEGIKK